MLHLDPGVNHFCAFQRIRGLSRVSRRQGICVVPLRRGRNMSELEGSVKGKKEIFPIFTNNNIKQIITIEPSKRHRLNTLPENPFL